MGNIWIVLLLYSLIDMYGTELTMAKLRMRKALSAPRTSSWRSA
jgi:hypothetical protein